jgi:hypothetical protein
MIQFVPGKLRPNKIASRCEPAVVSTSPNKSELEHVLFGWFKHSGSEAADHGKRCEFVSLYRWFILEFLWPREIHPIGSSTHG